jgi:hypothetical protein
MSVTVFTQNGNGELKMTGSVWIAGAQVISQIPEEVVALFEASPELLRIAHCYKNEEGREWFVVYNNPSPATQGLRGKE